MLKADILSENVCKINTNFSKVLNEMYAGLGSYQVLYPTRLRQKKVNYVSFESISCGLSSNCYFGDVVYCAAFHAACSTR